MSDKSIDNVISGAPVDIDEAKNQGSQPIEQDIDDYGNTATAYDVMLQSAVATNKQLSKKHKKSYLMGVVVLTESIARFDLEMETSPSYAAQLCGDSAKPKGNSKAGQLPIFRVRVYIPELHGFLPMLSKSQVQEYSKYVSGKVGSEGLDIDPDSTEYKRYLLFEKTLSRITPFYYVGSSRPPENKTAKVQLSDENTMFYGTFLHTVGAS